MCRLIVFLSPMLRQLTCGWRTGIPNEIHIQSLYCVFYVRLIHDMGPIFELLAEAIYAARVG